MNVFQIAISFSGVDREYVREVDRCLLQWFDEQAVFYDERYKELMARPALDEWLEDLFARHAELVVIVLSREADHSMWCLAEKRAVSRAISAGRIRRAPMLLTRGDVDISGGLQADWAVRIEDHTPRQMAELIVKRYRHECPAVVLRTPDKRQRRVRIEVALMLAVVLAAVAVNVVWSGRVGEDSFGVLSLVSVAALMGWSMLRVSARMLSRKSVPDYQNEPQAGEEEPDPLAAWVDYARQLEERVASELGVARGLQSRIRQAKWLMLNSMVFSIVLGIGHCIGELALRHFDGQSFLARPDGAEGFKWGVVSVLEHHHGHLWLLGAYVAFTAFVAFWVGNRLDGRWKVAFMVGACPALYMGIFYLLFVVSRNYEAFFGGKGPDGFFDEVGNFYVIERLVVVPVICFVVALLAVEFGKLARGQRRAA